MDLVKLTKKTFFDTKRETMFYLVIVFIAFCIYNELKPVLVTV